MSPRKKKLILISIIFVIIALAISSFVYTWVDKRYYIGVVDDSEG